MPKGDRWGSPPGRRQFRLASLLWLLTAGTAVLAVGRTLHCGPTEMIVLLCLTVGLWWQVAEIRDAKAHRDSKTAGALREEIKRWKQGGGHP
ncbi:MAG: hypothetical protein HUU20_12250 [Pirellulales bacterium]|nr:hypothetical protein [Pirellulales bacterium]